MFKKLCEYSHLYSRDLNIIPIKISYVDSERTKMKVMFVYKTTGMVAETSNIEIKSEDYQYWILVKSLNFLEG